LIFHTFDADYIRRLTDGDPATEEHFAAYFSELLLLKLRSRLRSPHLIEDVRQETLLRVLQSLRRKGGVEYPERFGAFVNSVCNNVLLEFRRSESRTDPMGEHDAEPADTTVNLDEPLVTSDLKRQVAQILDALSERDRQLLRAIFLEEQDKAAVCARFHVDQNYLRVLLHRAKSRIRKGYDRAMVGGS
jgi:RNA polymerase sigma-70 factor, ECF subfamily